MSKILEISLRMLLGHRGMNYQPGLWLAVAGLFIAVVGGTSAQTDPGAVDMSLREPARTWFNFWWPKTYGAPMGYTGDAANGIPGDTSPAFKDEILLRVNLFRRMTGEQPVVFDSEYNRKDQLAAMMFSAN